MRWCDFSSLQPPPPARSNKTKNHRDSQSLLPRSAAVVGVKVDVLEQHPLHDAPRPVDEVLELLRQDDHLLLLLAQLPHCDRPSLDVPRLRLLTYSPSFTSCLACSCSSAVTAGCTSFTWGRPCGRIPGGSLLPKPPRCGRLPSSSSPCPSSYVKTVVNKGYALSPFHPTRTSPNTHDTELD
jgi:hypothetical protein